MVTQKDVAKKAKVSSATISRYINNEGFISEKLKKRINKTIEELDYRPNLIARSLKTRSTKSIGLIFPDIENIFFLELVKYAEDTAFNAGYNVILCNTGNNPLKEKVYINILKNKMVDGYLIITSLKDKEFLNTTLKNDNVIFLDRSLGIKNRIVIKLNNVKGVMLAVDYLISLGHRKIGLINVTHEITVGKEIHEGYKRSLKKANISFNGALEKIADFTEESGYQKTLELLKQDKKITGLFTISDRITIGALKAIKKLNLKIPDDISIVGFDDFSATVLMAPPLTTIREPTKIIGETGVKLLIKLINGEKLKPETIDLEPKLIIRESCKSILLR